MNDIRGTPLAWQELDVLEALRTPAWVLDVERMRNPWANQAGLELWRAGSLEELRSREYSELSDAARARLDGSLEMVGNGQVFDDYWTIFPGGVPVTFQATVSGIVLEDGRLGLLFRARLVGEREFPGELNRRVESYRHAPSPISLHRIDGVALLRNPAAIRCFGPIDETAGRDDLAIQLGSPKLADAARAVLHEQGVHRQRALTRTRQGDRWFDFELRRVPDPLTGESTVLVCAQDVTEAQSAGQRLAAENRVLEMISTGNPLADVMETLAREIESLSPGMSCSVLMLDGDSLRIRHMAAPSLPQAFSAGIDGAQIGPAVGSCGTAMHRRETVIVTDIAADPLWDSHRELALAHGLRACWSVPILGASGQVLGSFAAYYRTVRSPGPREMALLETGRHIAGIAIERDRAVQMLQTRSAQLQMVMDAMPFSIAFADQNFRYVVVNRSFEEQFKRSREEVIGKHTWEVIGRELFDRIKPYMDEVVAGREVKYERDSIDENGNVRHLEVHYLPQIGEDGSVLGHFGIVRDITGRKRDEALLQFLANHDQLTLLPNRNQFTQRLNEAIARATRHKQRVSVLFIDLDRFKTVNDTLGHESGDALLVAVANRFRAALREIDVVARLGGDEFTVILGELDSPQEAATTAQRLLGTLAEPFEVQDQEVFASASIGISIFPDDGADAATLLRHADMAMYRAKDLGKNIFQFFSLEATAASAGRLRLESSLRRALEREEFTLHYQPMVELEEGRVTGMEALLRWHHPELGTVPPATFIPLAEETGLIVPIGHWVLETACRQARALQESGVANLRVSVNLSPKQFRRKDLEQSIADVLGATGLHPDQLELEVTESSVMENPEVAVRTLHALKEMGVHLSIDDFGTGYSSLSQLKRLPIDALKVDQSFVRDIPADEDDAAITSAIIAMGHRLRLTLLAEGVETVEQLAFLRERGCHRAQGFLIGRPASADEFAALLERGLPRFAI